ncbi:AMMECR1 domain-containing protein [Scheffersomyces coipomensis]|uniref:AMMECR1 domain-containing protein n=1 Tax=Scheffersomyces coipomensis TaxID=1788519 RepID=UPI00315CE80F
MSKALCCFAFESLQNKVNHTTSTKIPLSTYFHQLSESSSNVPSSAPLFITWNQNEKLRGCIGTFQAQPIETGVKQYSLIAALQDHRFYPISKSELNSDLSVSVTLLDNFIPIESSEDWEIGLNGLKVSFDFEDQHYSGTFLPSVAEEEEWDKVTTLYYLLKKSDFNYVKKDKVLSFYAKGLKEGWMTLTRYDGLKSSLSYDDFVSIREDINK